MGRPLGRLLDLIALIEQVSVRMIGPQTSRRWGEARSMVKPPQATIGSELGPAAGLTVRSRPTLTASTQ